MPRHGLGSRPVPEARPTQSVALRVVDRLRRLRHASLTRTQRRVVYVLALGLFAGSTVAAWRSLPAGTGDIDWRLVGWAALLTVPGAIVNADEYRISARIVGLSVPIPSALRVAVTAAAFNLLPIPGSVVVRTAALARGGVTATRAAATTGAVGLAYIAVAVIVAGAAQLTGSLVSATSLGLAGIGIAAAACLLVRRLSSAGTLRLLGRLFVVESLSVVVKAARLLLCLRALGFEPTLAQAAAISVATVAASAIGIMPGGLGVREVLAALIAPTVDLPAAVGLAGTALDRLTGMVALSVLAAVVVAATRTECASADAGVSVS